MSEKERERTEIEPRRSRRPQVSEKRQPTRTDGSETPAQAGVSEKPETLADAVANVATRPKTVDTEAVTATLVGIPELELEEFVYAHQLPQAETNETRPVALFDLENNSTQPLRWRSARTKFIGSDQYTYQAAHLSLEPSQLGAGCHTRQVEIEPQSKARMVTMVERLPAGVEVSKIVQTIARRSPAENERLVFSLE